MARTAALLCLLVLVSGCGADESEEAEQTVRDFVTAVRERDEDTFCDELVTEEYLGQATGATGDAARETCKREFGALRGLRVRLVRVVRTTVDGEEARVRAVIERQGQPIRQTFRLKREGGDWKLSGAGE